MTTTTKIVLCYLCIVNMLAFVLYGMDKSRAKGKKWRISEKTLLLTALIGGSAGALAAMYTFRHKTKHLLFCIGVPTMLIVQLCFGFWLLSQ